MFYRQHLRHRIHKLHPLSLSLSRSPFSSSSNHATWIKRRPERWMLHIQNPGLVPTRTEVGCVIQQRHADNRRDLSLIHGPVKADTGTGVMVHSGTKNTAGQWLRGAFLTPPILASIKQHGRVRCTTVLAYEGSGRYRSELYRQFEEISSSSRGIQTPTKNHRKTSSWIITSDFYASFVRCESLHRYQLVMKSYLMTMLGCTGNK